MNFDLSAIELRVMCALAEKESTTPDQYPLSTNALRSACNQKTSRDPITDVSEADIESTILSLRERGLVRSLKPTGSRSWKHRQTLPEVLPLTDGELALVTVLGLRGPQTPGELRQRTERISSFESVEELEGTLQGLANRDNPVVENLGREPGQSQDRWMHRLSSDTQSPQQGRQRVMAAEFAALHESGFFALPNPWDLMSAKAMEAAGAKAVATSSAALAAVLGKDDYGIERSELVDHVAQLAEHLTIPVHVDSEQLFPNDPGGIAETVRLLAGAGAAGVSIEDFDPATESIIDRSAAIEAVTVAVDACRQHHLVLTARHESHLYGPASLDETIECLSAYADAGADCVYAPGLTDTDEIQRLVENVGAPVNVLALPDAPESEFLELIGVRRASTGSLLFRNVERTMVAAITNFLGNGSL